MSPDIEFVNSYIERMVQEIVELTKTRLLNEARLSYIESVNKKLLLKIEDLESQIDKQNKRKAKEVNTSEVI
jgi:hypothetical protein